MANQVIARFEKLRPVQKVGVFAAIIGVVVAGWYFLLYKKVVEELETQQNRGNSLSATVGALTTKKQNFDKLKIALAQLKAKADPDVVLPDKAQIPALLKTLQDDATLAGIQIIKWDIQNEVPFYANGVVPPAPGAPPPAPAPGQAPPPPGAATPPMRVPVAIVMRGSFNKLNRWFFAAYGSKSDAPGEDKRLISIEQLKIQPDSDAEAQAAGLLTASFVASTFRKADAPPPLPGQAAGAPSLKAPVLKNADTVEKMDK